MKKPGHVASYDARIVRFCDGDTVVVELDLGWGIRLTKPLRLEGVDSWENSGPEAALCERARRELTNCFHLTACLVIPTTKGLDRYGRLRGHIMLSNRELGQYIIENGYGWRSDSPRTNRPPAGFRPFQCQTTETASPVPAVETISEVSQ